MATKKAKKVTTTTTTTTTTTVTSAPSKSRIFFILDRSGSMHTLREAAVGGFNKFIADQRAVEGEAEVSLTIFDNTVETVFSGVDLHAVKELTQADFVPRGYTALYDALGQTITAARDTHSDDVQTIIVVMTDGAENASREFTQAAVQALVKDVEATLGWETIFLGANIDVSAVSHSLGIKSKNAVAFAASAVGISAAYSNTTMATTAYRSGNKSFSFDGSSV
jgi:Mg-chelatase subunit ChlD